MANLDQIMDYLADRHGGWPNAGTHTPTAVGSEVTATYNISKSDYAEVLVTNQQLTAILPNNVNSDLRFSGGYYTNTTYNVYETGYVVFNDNNIVVHYIINSKGTSGTASGYPLNVYYR